MIDAIQSFLTPEVITVFFFIGIFVGLLSGYYIGIVIAGLGLALGLLVLGPLALEVMYARFYKYLMDYILLAIPLFIFMGDMIQYSGIADRLYQTLYVALGPVRGGLALATVLFGTVLAACLGIIAASVSMLCILGLVPMLKRGYAKDLACGCVAAGGCLGILIPPSIMIVLYGPIAGVSVGKLFMGAFPAGFFLAFLYCIYIVIRSLVRPHDAPALPKEERTTPTGKKLKDLAVSLVPPILLILSVLGVIFFGIAAPTEAAGMGAFAATLLAIVYRRFSFKVFKDVALDTLRVSGYIFFMSTLTYAAIGLFMRMGCAEVIGNIILATPGGKWAIFAVIQFFVFALGFFMGWLPIIFIVVPIISPLLEPLGFDPVWFALMVMVNLQASFMTPPMALAIFLVKNLAPPEITTADVIKGVIPFVLIILLALLFMVIFPDIVLWLPNHMIKPWT
jgi:tripartite ATP-independent transporter DctM subunit